MHFISLRFCVLVLCPIKLFHEDFLELLFVVVVVVIFVDDVVSIRFSLICILFVVSKRYIILCSCCLEH